MMWNQSRLRTSNFGPSIFALAVVGLTGCSGSDNMTTMVNNVKAAGAKPILVTPPARIGYTLPEELVNSLGVDVSQVIRDLGTSLGVPVIDLTVTVWNWQQTIGSNWPNYYALGTDHTHTSQAGADVISGFVATAIENQNIELSSYLR